MSPKRLIAVTLDAVFFYRFLLRRIKEHTKHVEGEDAGLKTLCFNHFFAVYWLKVHLVKSASNIWVKYIG